MSSDRKPRFDRSESIRHARDLLGFFRAEGFSTTDAIMHVEAFVGPLSNDERQHLTKVADRVVNPHVAIAKAQRLLAFGLPRREVVKHIATRVAELIADRPSETCPSIRTVGRWVDAARDRNKEFVETDVLSALGSAAAYLARKLQEVEELASDAKRRIADITEALDESFASLWRHDVSPAVARQRKLLLRQLEMERRTLETSFKLGLELRRELLAVIERAANSRNLPFTAPQSLSSGDGDFLTHADAEQFLRELQQSM